MTWRFTPPAGEMLLVVTPAERVESLVEAKHAINRL